MAWRPLDGLATAPTDDDGGTSASADVLRRFQLVRARSLALAAPLSPEDQTAQSMPDASPTKWHLAHTTWFFETMVLAEGPGYAPFDPAFGYLFNSYYESLGPRQPRMHRGLLTRPSVALVREYRAHVDAAMTRRLQAGDLSSALMSRVVLGLAHEEQHQELLLTDVLHLLAQNPLRPAYEAVGQNAIREASCARFMPFEGGVVEIGAHIGDGLSGPFAFDNEGPRHKSYCQPFALADQLVTNAEWLAFINAGGYSRPEFWLSDGWSAIRSESWIGPLYWEKSGSSWNIFGPAGLAELDPNAPVAHVSFYEADAFARWCGRRLPTETEWEFAATSRPDAFRDLFGSVWQWTGSPYTPYPGFTPSPGALGEYNGKFMVNQIGLRGSSWATSPGHSRPTYRNFFPPSARWQVTGVRLASDGAVADPASEKLG